MPAPKEPQLGREPPEQQLTNESPVTQPVTKVQQQVTKEQEAATRPVVVRERQVPEEQAAKERR